MLGSRHKPDTPHGQAPDSPPWTREGSATGELRSPTPFATTPDNAMHILEFDPVAKTIIEVSMDQYARRPDCRYLKVQGKRLDIPVVSENGVTYVVWQHPDW